MALDERFIGDGSKFAEQFNYHKAGTSQDQHDGENEEDEA